ncbi:MAG: hypothetical protein ACR5LF_13100 [Symbiopectobacterium sp.]
MDGEIEDCDVAILHSGDIFVVRPGESIPVDGVILDSLSEVNESMLTGECVPVVKMVGAEVFGATLTKAICCESKPSVWGAIRLWCVLFSYGRRRTGLKSSYGRRRTGLKSRSAAVGR